MPELNAIVIQRIDFNPGLMILRVAPVGWELPAFKPGQFCALGLPPPLAAWLMQALRILFPRRMLSSVAPTPSPRLREREYLEFYISQVKSGALTPGFLL